MKKSKTKYSEFDKEFALTLFDTCSRAYKVCRQTFPLPNERTIHLWRSEKHRQSNQDSCDAPVASNLSDQDDVPLMNDISHDDSQQDTTDNMSNHDALLTDNLIVPRHDNIECPRGRLYFDLLNCFIRCVFSIFIWIIIFLTFSYVEGIHLCNLTVDHSGSCLIHRCDDCDTFTGKPRNWCIHWWLQGIIQNLYITRLTSMRLESVNCYKCFKLIASPFIFRLTVAKLTPLIFLCSLTEQKFLWKLHKNYY